MGQRFFSYIESEFVIEKTPWKVKLTLISQEIFKIASRLNLHDSDIFTKFFLITFPSLSAKKNNILSNEKWWNFFSIKKIPSSTYFFAPSLKQIWIALKVRINRILVLFYKCCFLITHIRLWAKFHLRLVQVSEEGFFL